MSETEDATVLKGRIGTIRTVAGTGKDGYNGDGKPAREAQLDGPAGVVVDAAGNVYIADEENHRVRRVDAQGIITTVAGTGKPGFGGDKGAAVAALLKKPTDLALDQDGNLYIADSRNHRVRRVDLSTGNITTVAGKGEDGYDGDNRPAVDARLCYPMGIAYAAGGIYVADSSNDRVRRVDLATGIITTVAGDGTRKADIREIGDGKQATQAHLYVPKKVAVDAGRNLYITDDYHGVIRWVNPSGVISSVAGAGAGHVQLNEETVLAVDAAGHLYIGNLARLRVYRLDRRAGKVSTIAGTGKGDPLGDDGPATEAGLLGVSGLAFDARGNLYIAENFRHRVRTVVGVAAPPVAPKVQTISGTSSDHDGQKAKPGEAFGQQLKVEARNNGALVPDARIRFTVTGNTGSQFTIAGDRRAAYADVITTKDGEAEAPVLRAGTTLGSFTIKVTAPDSPKAAPCTYKAHVTAG